MSSGAKQQLQIVKEVTVGVTPSPFARQSLPFTELTIDGAVTREDSATILDSRIAQSGSLTGVDYTGDLNAEFRYSVYDDLIAAAAYNAWVGDTLTFGGDLRQTFSLVRGYDDISNYHVFRGVHVNTWNLDIPEQGIITTSFGLIGLGRIGYPSNPAGTVTRPDLTPTFSSVSVGDILIDGVSQAGIACITAFDFTWDNSSVTQRCLGKGLDIGAILATLANGTGSFTAAWSATAADHYEKQFKNETLGLVIPFTDSEDNTYVLTLPKVEITASLPSGGNGDILQATFEYRVIEEAPTLTRATGVAVTGVTVAPDTATIATIGGTQQLTAAIAPVGATNQEVTWVSSNNAVATVDQDGLVTATGEGTATITAITESGGFEDSAVITVDITP